MLKLYLYYNGCTGLYYLIIATNSFMWNCEKNVEIIYDLFYTCRVYQ